MSGHSKWSTIKRQKGVKDAQKGKIFTRLANAITIAVREGGGSDAASNFRLRLAIEKARQENMPKENIEKAIDRGTGKAGDEVIDTVQYEGFGPGGVAIMVDAITDNRNRTSSEMKMTFDKYGGAFAQPGTVRWQFDQLGVITVPKTDQSIDDVMLLAIDAGADDVQDEDDIIAIYTQPNAVHNVKNHLDANGVGVEDIAIILRTKQPVGLSETDKARVIAFLERIEDLDDVQAVYTNADL